MPRLTSLADIKAELAATYRRGLNGSWPWSDCTKAAHVLGLLAKLVEGSTIEDRLSQLEAAMLLPPGARANGHDDDDAPLPH